ncbi:MAG: radical SAM protein, partial [candidate division Zixibacteria bacterium]
MADIRFLTDISRIDQISESERKALAPVVEAFRFQVSDYYLSLINWDDPHDPIRKLIIPNIGELSSTGELDASDEKSNYVAPGLQHKYPHTALLVCTESCASFCRYCFRKRLFMQGNGEVNSQVDDGISYIAKTPDISNVLLTGGDPLTLPTDRLESIISAIRKIDHVGIIRIGTKTPAFNPYRILDD